MTRTLLIMRHGKSDWDAAFERDADRPLARRGREAARVMGRALTRVGYVPQLVLCSSAARTRETTALAMEAGVWSCDVAYEDALYESGTEDVLQVIRRQADKKERVLLVGHEPTSSDLIAALVGGGSHRFPTAAVASIDVGVDRWADVTTGRGQLRWLVTPKLLAPLEEGM